MDRGYSDAGKEPLLVHPTRRQTTIQPLPAWSFLDWREVWTYRELLFILAWRDIKVRYAQAVVGIGWALVQPLMSMVVFSIIFGNLAKISSEGVPYPVFSYIGLLPWTYFAAVVRDGSLSLVNSSSILGKVYFPRVIFPITPVLSNLLDLTVSSSILALIMMWYDIGFPGVRILLVPIFLGFIALCALGIALWLSALAVLYRDVKHIVGFSLSLLMYLTPVLYSSTLIPESYRLLYGLNPMVGFVEGIRVCVLGNGKFPLESLGVGITVTVLLVVSGLWYFHNTERVFADVV